MSLLNGNGSGNFPDRLVSSYGEGTEGSFTIIDFSSIPWEIVQFRYDGNCIATQFASLTMRYYPVPVGFESISSHTVKLLPYEPYFGMDSARTLARTAMWMQEFESVYENGNLSIYIGQATVKMNNSGLIVDTRAFIVFSNNMFSLEMPQNSEYLLFKDFICHNDAVVPGKSPSTVYVFAQVFLLRSKFVSYNPVIGSNFWLDKHKDNWKLRNIGNFCWGSIMPDGICV